MGTAARFSNLTSPTPPSTSVPSHAHQTIIEEDIYNPDDPLNANNLEMALYSPLPHLQFTSHSNGLGVTTPLEDWIKHPNNLTLSSDTLIASLHPSDTNNISAPATPTSLFSEPGPLPPFSQASMGNLSTVQNFALPPLENALDFGNVDLDQIPP